MFLLAAALIANRDTDPFDDWGRGDADPNRLANCARTECSTVACAVLLSVPAVSVRRATDGVAIAVDASVSVATAPALTNHAFGGIKRVDRLALIFRGLELAALHHRDQFRPNMALASAIFAGWPSGARLRRWTQRPENEDNQ